MENDAKYKRSPIFYMGNKYKLLKYLIPLFPKQCNVFVDAFGGSGVVSMNYQGQEKTIYNEFNHNVVNLIDWIKSESPEEINSQLNDIIIKMGFKQFSVKAQDRKNKQEYKQRGEPYYKLREIYNNGKRSPLTLFLLLCYSNNHLMRFNTNDEFNASIGSDSYNDKNYSQIKDMHESFQNVTILNKNVFDLDLSTLNMDDFVYFDPPYLNTEAVYNEKRAFGGWKIDDDYKLFKLIENLDERGVKWGMSNVFANRGKENSHLKEWCIKHHWNVHHLERNYNPFSRGNSNNDEVYICNYKTSDSEIKQRNLTLSELLNAEE